MVKVLQQLDLSKGSQTEHGVVEWSDLFDGHLLSSGLVDGRTNGNKESEQSCES